jgi:hypothetical protein
MASRRIDVSFVVLSATSAYHEHAGTSEALQAKLLIGQTFASTAVRRSNHHTAAMIAPSWNFGSALQPYAADGRI